MPELLTKLTGDFKKSKVKNTYDIQLDIDEALCIKAIESDVYSLCQNLLSNAIKYSPEGSEIKVTWSMSDEQNLCLEVEDNGEGIAPEHLSRLTERFYRVNVARSRQVGGTGLGLSIVRHILENHGGYLDIRSELGKGSTFCAYFPRYRAIQSESFV
jgi:two-component system phosphate regulon sensor histidine kinase PhoR